MIFAHLKFDYEQLCEDDQFEIMDRYMKESKLYITIIVGKYEQIIKKQNKNYIQQNYYIL